MAERQSCTTVDEFVLLIFIEPDEKLLPVEPIASEVLLETYKRKLADEARLFLAEFQVLPPHTALRFFPLAGCTALQRQKAKSQDFRRTWRDMDE